MTLLLDDPFNNKVTCVCMNFERLGEIKELQHKGEQKLLFQFLECPMLLLFPFKRQGFFLGGLKVVSPSTRILL